MEIEQRFSHGFIFIIKKETSIVKVFTFKINCV